MEPSEIYAVTTIVCALAGLAAWLWLWLTKDKNLNQAPVKEIWRRTNIHLIWLALYLMPVIAYLVIAFVFIGQDLVERDGTWHQTIVRDESGPDYSELIARIAAVIFFTSGIGSFLYAKTRLPFFASKNDVNYPVFVFMPYVFMAYFFSYYLPNISEMGDYTSINPLNTMLHMIWLNSTIMVSYQVFVNLRAVWLAYR